MMIYEYMQSIKISMLLKLVLILIFILFFGCGSETGKSSSSSNNNPPSRTTEYTVSANVYLYDRATSVAITNGRINCAYGRVTGTSDQDGNIVLSYQWTETQINFPCDLTAPGYLGYYDRTITLRNTFPHYTQAMDLR